jgi:hypothetical protein
LEGSFQHLSQPSHQQALLGRTQLAQVAQAQQTEQEAQQTLALRLLAPVVEVAVALREVLQQQAQAQSAVQVAAVQEVVARHDSLTAPSPLRWLGETVRVRPISRREAVEAAASQSLQAARRTTMQARLRQPAEQAAMVAMAGWLCITLRKEKE